MKTLTDLFLKKIILLFMTQDEWHTAVIGFFDGLSFSIEGKWMRKALSKRSISVAHIETEKIWYYRAPYVLGEFTKVITIALLVKWSSPSAVGLISEVILLG